MELISIEKDPNQQTDQPKTPRPYKFGGKIPQPSKQNDERYFQRLQSCIKRQLKGEILLTLWEVKISFTLLFILLSILMIAFNYHQLYLPSYTPEVLVTEKTTCKLQKLFHLFHQDSANCPIMSTESNELETTTKSLLDEENRQKSASFRIRKQQKQDQEKHQIPKQSQHPVIQKRVLNILKSSDKDQNPSFINKKKTELLHQNEVQQPDQIDFSNFCQKILFYQYINQKKKIQAKQSKLSSQSRHILCKISSMIILIALFFIVLLKVFLFFSNQFIGTVIQSFKEQLFDPKITNDQLQLQIFYIEEVCLLITILLLFLFVIFCTIMVKKFYIRNINIYRRNSRVLAGLNVRKDQVSKQLDLLNSANILS